MGFMFSLLFPSSIVGMGEGVCMGVLGLTSGKLLVVPEEELKEDTDGL